MRHVRVGVILATFAAVMCTVVAVPPAAPRVAHAAAALSFTSCNDTQKTEIQQAFIDAGTYAENAVAYFEKNKAGNRFTYWFGAFDASRRTTTAGYVTAIRDAIALVTPANGDCSGTSCTSGVFAFVYPTETATHPIHFCDAFWAASATGTDSKAGTLIHEFSHFVNVATTQDHVYGQTSAHNLAVTTPANAPNNADNYEYFFENTPATADNSPAYTYSSATADFGSHEVGTTEFSRVVTVTNWGDATLNITTVTASAEFQVSGTCANSSLPALSSCAVTVTFAPASAGSKTGTLSVATNALVTPTAVALTAIATPVATTTTSTTTTTTTTAPTTTTTVPATTTSTTVTPATTTPAPATSIEVTTTTIPVTTTTAAPVPVALRVAAVSRSSRLKVTAAARSLFLPLPFTVQKKSAGTWRRVGGARTLGTTGAVTIDLPRGVYRVTVSATAVRRSFTSTAVTLQR